MEGIATQLVAAFWAVAAILASFAIGAIWLILGIRKDLGDLKTDVAGVKGDVQALGVKVDAIGQRLDDHIAQQHASS